MNSVATAVPAKNHPAFWACCLFLAIVVARYSELIPVLASFQLGQVSAAILLLSLLAGPKDSVEPLFSTVVSKRVFLFIGFVVLSVTFSIWKGRSANFVQSAILANLILFSAIVMTTRTIDNVRSLAKVLIVGALIFSARGIFAGNWDTRIEVQSAYDQNDLALYLICTIPFILAEVSLSGKTTRRLMYAAFAGTSVLMMVLTQSRGGFLALIGLMLVLILFSGFRVDRKPANFGTRVGRVVGLVIVSLLFIQVMPDAAKERLFSITDLSEDYNVVSDREGRFAIWGRGLEYLKSHPWGAGVASYQVVDNWMGGQFRTAHNSFVQVATEIGVIGFIVYMLCFYALLKGFRQSQRRIRETADSATAQTIAVYAYSQALWISLICFCIAGFFLSAGYSGIIFTLFAVGGVLLRLASRLPDSTAIVPAAPREGRR